MLNQHFSTKLLNNHQELLLSHIVTPSHKIWQTSRFKKKKDRLSWNILKSWWNLPTVPCGQHGKQAWRKCDSEEMEKMVWLALWQIHVHACTPPPPLPSLRAALQLMKTLTFLHARHTSIYGKIRSQDAESVWGQQELNIKGWFWSMVVTPSHPPEWFLPLPETFLQHTTWKSTFSIAISNWTLKVSSVKSCVWSAF